MGETGKHSPRQAGQAYSYASLFDELPVQQGLRLARRSEQAVDGPEPQGVVDDGHPDLLLVSEDDGGHETCLGSIGQEAAEAHHADLFVGRFPVKALVKSVMAHGEGETKEEHEVHAPSARCHPPPG